MFRIYIVRRTVALEYWTSVELQREREWTIEEKWSILTVSLIFPKRRCCFYCFLFGFVSDKFTRIYWRKVKYMYWSMVKWSKKKYPQLMWNISNKWQIFFSLPLQAIFSHPLYSFKPSNSIERHITRCTTPQNIWVFIMTTVTNRIKCKMLYVPF